MSQYCTYEEDCLGVTLYDTEGNDVYLQESNGYQLLAEIAVVEKIWSKRDFKPYVRKHKGCFDSYEEHISALIEPYFY
jgi:hypothetical protein